MNEAERLLVEEIKPRLDNWARCYKYRPHRQVSITAVVIRALKEAFYDPAKDPDANKFRGVPADEVWIDEPDYRDADFIEQVWAGMAHEQERDLRIPNTGITIATAKIIIFLYEFASDKNYIGYLRGSGINSRYYDTTIDHALLFFANRVKAVEAIRKNT